MFLLQSGILLVSIERSKPEAPWTPRAGSQRYRDADRWPTEEVARGHARQPAGGIRGGAQCPARRSRGAVQAAAARLGDSGRLIYVGAGASGRLAVQDGVELYPTFGWPHERLVYLLAGGEAALVRSLEGAEDDAAAGEPRRWPCAPTAEPTSWSRWPPRAPPPSPAPRRRPRARAGALTVAHGQQPRRPAAGRGRDPGPACIPAPSSSPARPA